MTTLRKYRFPFRLSDKQLPALYASLEEAFGVRDFLYVARYGESNPELHGCALIMLGNRVGGERILDRARIKTPNTCLYRAYAAWQDDDHEGARHCIAEARALGSSDVRLDRLTALMKHKTFRIVLQSNFCRDDELESFRHLPDFDVYIIRQFQDSLAKNLPLTHCMTGSLPPGPPVDLVLIDNLSILPVGLDEWNAPVAVSVHDSEYNYEFLDQVISDIDLLAVGSTTESIELGRAFDRDVTVCFYPIPLRVPQPGEISITEKFHDTTKHTTDILHTGGIAHDFYRHKRQEILCLAQLDESFSIKIAGTRFSIQDYWELMKSTRFSIMSTRYCNYMPTRTLDALMCGTLPLVDEDNGLPYIFSERFACFPAYRRETILADVEGHLRNYQTLLNQFRKQLPQFEAEFKSLFPENKLRTQRYLRHLLWMTKVEKDDNQRAAKKVKSSRTMAYFNEYDFFDYTSAHIKQLLEQTPPSHKVRRALMAARLVMAEKGSAQESLGALKRALEDGLFECPQSMVLHYTRGFCQRLLMAPEDANQSFQTVIEGNLQLDPHDPISMKLGRGNSVYWVCDARVRARCSKDVLPLASAETVIKSYAWANRAEIALHRALAHPYLKHHSATTDMYKTAIDFAEKSLGLFQYNDGAERTYLRAAFGLALLGLKGWDDIFMRSFDIACYNDYTVLHDLGVLVVHVATLQGDTEKAAKTLADIKRYNDRVQLPDYETSLYSEAIPYFFAYRLSHTKLKSISQ